MTWRIALAGCLTATTLTISPAHACVPMPPEPRLAGENNATYEARVEAERRAQIAEWDKARQADNLQNADAVFLARDTPWPPTYRPQLRNGRPIPPVIRAFRFPAPAYFKPIDWFRGPKSTALFKVGRYMTDCGSASGVGDTGDGTYGDLFVFFAHKGPLSEKVLIDAIAVDRISNPALMEFVAKYRSKSLPNPSLPQ